MTQITAPVRQAAASSRLSPGDSPRTLETLILDLLTDTLHLARIEGLDACQLGSAAMDRFLIEIKRSRITDTAATALSPRSRLTTWPGPGC